MNNERIRQGELQKKYHDMADMPAPVDMIVKRIRSIEQKGRPSVPVPPFHAERKGSSLRSKKGRPSVPVPPFHFS